jgi:hypothetical protein
MTTERISTPKPKILAVESRGSFVAGSCISSLYHLPRIIGYSPVIHGLWRFPRGSPSYHGCFNTQSWSNNLDELKSTPVLGNLDMWLCPETQELWQGPSEGLELLVGHPAAGYMDLATAPKRAIVIEQIWLIILSYIIYIYMRIIYIYIHNILVTIQHHIYWFEWANSNHI